MLNAVFSLAPWADSTKRPALTHCKMLADRLCQMFLTTTPAMLFM